MRRGLLRVSSVLGSIVLAAGVVSSTPARRAAPAPELWRQVEVIRTAHGVPHIRAENLRAAGYALAWVMSEDYGARTGMRLVGARGELARFEGRARLDADFENRRARARAIATYHLLDPETRDIYDGFAAGINRYVDAPPRPSSRPACRPTSPATTSRRSTSATARRRRRCGGSSPRQRRRRAGGSDVRTIEPSSDDDGSNAWALAPSRTKSGKAILLRNPHLAWTAGYYEAHMTVPGVDRFLRRLPHRRPAHRHRRLQPVPGLGDDQQQQRRPERDLLARRWIRQRPDHYLLDGASLPLARETDTVTFKDGDGLSIETREFWSTPLGPVVHRTADRIFIVRTAGDGEFRAGEQFLRMMRASSLAEWKDAMRMRALVTSNYTYADRAGNIFYLWNASLPLLPHPTGGDAATPVTRHARAVDALHSVRGAAAVPQSPAAATCTTRTTRRTSPTSAGASNTVNAYPNIEPPMLRLRSQHAIELIDNNRKLSLEDVVRLKHSYRMLLADRVKADLVAAVRATKPAGDVAAALALLRRWNNTAAPESRGATLFEVWFQRYAQGRQGPAVFAHDWSVADPAADAARPGRSRARGRGVRVGGGGDGAPARPLGRGVGRRPPRAARRGRRAGRRLFGPARLLPRARLRARRGRQARRPTAATAGCSPSSSAPRRARTRCSRTARARDPESPWHADQAAMFARGEMKRVAFTARDVDAQAVARTPVTLGAPGSTDN